MLFSKRLFCEASSFAAPESVEEVAAPVGIEDVATEFVEEPAPVEEEERTWFAHSSYCSES